MDSYHWPTLKEHLVLTFWEAERLSRLEFERMLDMDYTNRSIQHDPQFLAMSARYARLSRLMDYSCKVLGYRDAFEAINALHLNMDSKW